MYTDPLAERKITLPASNVRVANIPRVKVCCGSFSVPFPSNRMPFICSCPQLSHPQVSLELSGAHPVVIMHHPKIPRALAQPKGWCPRHFHGHSTVPNTQIQHKHGIRVSPECKTTTFRAQPTSPPCSDAPSLLIHVSTDLVTAPILPLCSKDMEWFVLGGTLKPIPFQPLHLPLDQVAPSWFESLKPLQ